MKKSLLLIPVLAAIAAISACGNSGEKGRVLARIDGETFTEGDLDLRLNTLDDARRAEVLKDPELRRREFDNILRNRLHALAGLSSSYGKSASLRRRQAMIDQRVITQYYFENFLNLQAGRTRAEIEAYYNANPKYFRDEKGVLSPLSEVQSRVIDSLLVRDGKVDSFFQAKSAAYKVRASSNVSIIRTENRKDADAALKALRGGMSFADAAKRYSTHASKDNGGSLGRLNEGEFNGDLGSQATADSLLFTAATRLKNGQYSGVVGAGNGFILVKSDNYTDARVPALGEVRAQVNADYVREYKEGLSQNAVPTLRAKHKVRLVTHDRQPTENEIRAYYNEHQAEYESPETFELYHIEASDEAKLTKAVAKVKDLNAFKALAAKMSENKMTRAQEGLVGTVKRDYSLPYGIGTLPALFSALDEIESGRVASLVENPAAKTWHAFWLVRKDPAKLKPLDRVHDLVLQDLKANTLANVSSTDTLAVIGLSGKVLREDDVIFLRQEIPASMQERYTRENLLDYIIIWEVFATEAQNLGLTKERKLRAQRLQSDDNYWAGVYRDSVLPTGWEQSPAVLSKLFNAQRTMFTRDTSAHDWKPFARDIAASQFLTERDFEIEYNTNPERYMRDSVPWSYAEARPSIFENLKSSAYTRLDASILEKLRQRFKVKIEDKTLLEPSLEPVAKTYKKAQDLHYDRKLDQALALYEQLRSKYPAKAGLQDSISFGVAQIYIEQERYAQAMAEYRRVSYLYPKSANNYKAMFMVGFIQSEHLRQDSAAVRSFEAMLKQYPSSDLSDDADWMVRNIRSGGQLMPTLEDDTETNGQSKESGQPAKQPE